MAEDLIAAHYEHGLERDRLFREGVPRLELTRTLELYDVMDLHVRQAQQAADAQPEHPFTAQVADARSLPEQDASADAVVLLGPLYHLTEQTQRAAALLEARRLLRPGGVVAAVGISRFSVLLDGLWQGWLSDPLFRAITERDLVDGQHRNPDPARYHL